MSWFGRTMSWQRYSVGITIRILLLVAVTAGFPFFVYFVASRSGASGGAGGAIALVMGLYLKPLIYLLFALSLVRPAARRAGTLGMSFIVGPLICCAILVDLGFGTLFFNHWSVAFTVGFISGRLPFPWLLAAAVAVLFALAILQQRNDEVPARQHFGLAYWIWLGLLGLAALKGLYLVISLVGGLMGLPPRWLLPAARLLEWLPKMPLAIAIMAASLWLIVQDRLGGGAAPRATPDEGSPPAPAPVRHGPPRTSFGLRRA